MFFFRQPLDCRRTSSLNFLLMLHFTAIGTDGRHLHKEATLLATAPDGRLCLWPVMEELPFVLPHPQASNALDADARAGSPFEARSRCVLRLEA